ncbi:Nuclear distribution protein nudE -like protein 1 [Halotydeus destructor]|nr:Nuclear distribution protein nudE -like protein 1 [Halotydeus destructor]
MMDTNEIIDDLRKRLAGREIELEEFQESSREYEAELEAQLSQAEKRIKEMTAINQRLVNENETIKNKLCCLTSDTDHQIQELQLELKETKLANGDLNTAIRELEQFNDDLERSKRALAASLDDFEARLSEQIERNVLLENELGEKDELEVIVQRLKDEAKELRQELLVQQQQSPSPLTSSSVNSVSQSSVLSRPNRRTLSLTSPTASLSRMYISSSTSGANGTNNNKTPTVSATSAAHQNAKNSPLSPSTNGPSAASNGYHGNPAQPPLPLLSPSTRISALNIVSDLLRKVGALESKLASCRNLVPPATPKTKAAAGKPTLTSPTS